MAQRPMSLASESTPNVAPVPVPADPAAQQLVVSVTVACRIR